MDEFLWEEELDEIRIGQKFLDSVKASIGVNDLPSLSAWILNALSSNSDRTDTYSLLMSLEFLILGCLGDVHPISNWAGVISNAFEAVDRNDELVSKISSQLSSLVALVSTNQLSLSRDTSRLSLMRQASMVSSTSSQHEPSVISAKIRLCLNILYTAYLMKPQSFSEYVPDIFETLLICLRLHADNMMPIRKVILFIFKILASHGRDRDIYLPPNTSGLDSSSSTSTLLQFIPLLSLPGLSDFRSFLALSLHQANLLNWSSPDGTRSRPVAIEEGVKICDSHIREFISTYTFHEAEVDMLRTDPNLSHVFRLYIDMKMCNRTIRKKRNDLSKSGFSSGRFSVEQLTQHMIANYHLSHDAQSVSAKSEAVSDFPDLPLVHEAYQSCSGWMGSQDEALIEAIAEAVVPDKSDPYLSISEGTESNWLDELFKSESHIQDTIVVLLKLLLSSCRGATDPVLSPTNNPSFDLDRDHLVAILERVGSPPSTPRDSILRRNFEIISSAICGIITLLVKLPSVHADLIQRAIVANNGCLVLLKLVTAYPNSDSSISAGSIFLKLRENKSWNLSVPPRLQTALFRSLKALYALCRNHVPRIKKYLVHYKVAVVLKRFFAIPNTGLLQMAYKLFKIQMRFLSKKWKLLHMKLLSNCYNVVSLEIVDDWIVNDPDESPAGQDDQESALISESATPFDFDAYREKLSKLNFENTDEITAFCKETGDDIDTFFGVKGIKTYSQWLRFTR